MSAALGIDLYQITTLVAHADEGRLSHKVAIGFSFRSMPPSRNFVVFCGLKKLLEHAAAMRFDTDDMRVLDRNPLVGPALSVRPTLRGALAAIRGFDGEIDALPEGTLAFAGPALDPDGAPVVVEDAPIHVSTPLVQVKTDLVRAKLCETPWLSCINHCSMVASKAARVVIAAEGAPVYEFGQRRTHPDAALDASYAAYVAGCAGTSNLRAHGRFGIPASGTMDHFAIQASERPGMHPSVTERAFFAAFHRVFQRAAFLLVDTYDVERGIRDAIEATGGALSGIRLDSGVTPDLVRKARAALSKLGAHSARIVVSDQLDEAQVAELHAAGADGFGVGEQITCVPDAAAGIGCNAKIVVNGYGKPTMKLCRGTGKASLPGLVQAYRFADHDIIATGDEPPPSGGRPLLQPVWRGGETVGAGRETVEESRRRVKDGIDALPPHLRGLSTGHGKPWPIRLSRELIERIKSCVAEMRGGI